MIKRRTSRCFERGRSIFTWENVGNSSKEPPKNDASKNPLSNQAIAPYGNSTWSHLPDKPNFLYSSSKKLRRLTHDRVSTGEPRTLNTQIKLKSSPRAIQHPVLLGQDRHESDCHIQGARRMRVQNTPDATQRHRTSGCTYRGLVERCPDCLIQVHLRAENVKINEKPRELTHEHVAAVRHRNKLPETKGATENDVQVSRYEEREQRSS